MGNILIVSGVPLAFWSKNKELNERFSAQAYADQPVLLEGMDGHTAWANKALLKRAGINKELISGLNSVGREYYGFGSDLEPNGFLVDTGVNRVRQVVPQPDEERMLAAGRAAVKYMQELGITAWLDPSRTTPGISHKSRRSAWSRVRLSRRVAEMAFESGTLPTARAKNS